jgi:hypothetical protein
LRYGSSDNRPLGKWGDREGFEELTPLTDTNTNLMNLEKTEIWITTERPLELSDGRAIREVLGNPHRNGPKFFRHTEDKQCFLR